MKTKIYLIAACCNGNGIGLGNKIPWKLKDDLQYFKDLTIKGTVIMGRATQDSLKWPLPDRNNIVVSSNPNNVKDGFTYASSLLEAINLAKEISREHIWVIGGESLYRQALEYADRLYITEVYENYECDKFFPDFDTTMFKEISSVGQNEYSFCVFERNKW